MLRLAMMHILQLALFLIPPALNIQYRYTDNLYLPALLGIGLAYGVTILLPDLTSGWRRKSGPGRNQHGIHE